MMKRGKEVPTALNRVLYPNVGGVHDEPTVRQLSVEFLDPETLAACWSTSKSFCLDPAFRDARKMANLFVLRRQVWRRYLRTWVPQMCKSPGWASKRLRRLRLGEVPKPIFIEVLRCHLFDAGLRLIPWSLPGYRYWDQLGKNVSVCAAGSYPLHKWMTEKSSNVEWTPNDVDIFVTYNSGPADDDDDDEEEEVSDSVAAKRVYKEIVRRWCDRFERQVLKEARRGSVVDDDEDEEDEGWTSLAEMARNTTEWYEMIEAEDRGGLPRVGMGNGRDGDTDRERTRGSRQCEFSIMAIRDLAIPEASILNAGAYEATFLDEGGRLLDVFTARRWNSNKALYQNVLGASASSDPIRDGKAWCTRIKKFFEAINIPVFSFILWRDLRLGSAPCLNRVLDTFDIDVCQVGIEGPPADDDDDEAKTTPWWTIVDDTGTRLRTRNEAVANAINQRSATVIRQYDATRTLKREQKYTSRGFNFALTLTQLPSSSSSS